jgi:hypothetical protein
MGDYLKKPIFRSEPLRRAVADLHCVCCGIHGYTQAAHIGGVGEGKGMGIKVPDSHIAALCGPHMGRGGHGLVPGCHIDFDHRAIDGDRGWEFVAKTYIALVESGAIAVKSRGS